MSEEQRRAAVKNAYLSPNWHEKVDRMSDKQVFVIYNRLLANGKIRN